MESTRLVRFERAMLPHLDAAHNLARWLTGSAQDAEDVVQDACLRALTFFDGFRGEDGRAWLLAITRHTCYDWLRKNRRQSELLAPPEELDLAADGAPGPEAEQLRNADRRLVREGLERLPASVGRLADLTLLHLNGNWLTGAHKSLSISPSLSTRNDDAAN